jgi:cell division transport system ATP-binding protein
VLDKINQNGTTVVMATHDDDIVNEMRKRVVELKNGVVIRDEARALYTSMIPVVGQSRRLRDASGRDEPPAASPRAETRAEARGLRPAGEGQA